jgi:hypothetical protein
LAGEGTSLDSLRIAVILPCFNEEAAIVDTVAGFRTALPTASIYVYDNNSRDRTAELARAAGAVVRTEKQQGKGHVVRRMFADVDADIYVMADGDLTYDPKAAPDMVRMLVDEQMDMVVGTRQHAVAEAYRGGHVIGNRLFTGRLRGCSGAASLTSSGYRVFPAICEKLGAVGGLRDRNRDQRARAGTAHAGRELVTKYGARPEGSASACDLSRRMADPEDHRRSIVERPVLFYGGLAALLIAVAIVLVVPLLITYLDTGLVPRFPTAILATGMVIVAVLSFFAGLILDTVTRGRREIRRLAYLAYPAPFVAEK